MGFVDCFGCNNDLRRARLASIEWAWNNKGIARLVDNPVPCSGFGSKNLVRVWLPSCDVFVFLLDALEQGNERILSEFLNGCHG